MTYFVTTPIYYPNSTPHVGHAYTTIAADVVSRYQRLIGEDSFFLTGTDEHGSKIAQAAEDAGVQPQEFVDKTSQVFRDLLDILDVGEHQFIRTTDKNHEDFVQKIAAIMYEKGDIYQGTYEGPYCTGCERFFAKNELLDDDLCPIHKRKVEHLEETNWFFKLSAYKEKLIEHFDNNPNWIRPKSRYNEARSLIDQLEDLSISRPSITWGVELPWDKTQVCYVWIDALFNYRSALEYLIEDKEQAARSWPPKLQLLAKDILKFHTVFWPAFLMSAGFELPKQLFIHGYLTAGASGEKMGKSMGNALDPFPLIERLGPDPIRFYLLREVSFGQDGAVSQESFERRYDGELANDLGNLVSRTLSMLVKYKGIDGKATVPATDNTEPIAIEAQKMFDTWNQQMQNIELSNALETIWSYVRYLNKHVEDRAPWVLAKSDSSQELLEQTLGELVEGIAAVAYTLSPFMPSTSEKIKSLIGIPHDSATSWRWGVAEGCILEKPKPIFPRLEATVA